MHLIGNEEQRLAKRLKDGENAAVREFYTLYADYLAGICSRYITDEDDQKDVLQESFMQMVSHIRDFQYRGAGSLQAWTARIVVSQSLKFLKAHNRQELVPLDFDVVEEVEDPPIGDVPPEVIHHMVSQLPTGYRTVLNLYVFEGRSHQEIARLLGISVGTRSTLLPVWNTASFLSSASTQSQALATISLTAVAFPPFIGTVR